MTIWRIAVAVARFGFAGLMVAAAIGSYSPPPLIYVIAALTFIGDGLDEVIALLERRLNER